VFIRGTDPLTQRHVEQYWVASRSRHDRWQQAMKSYSRCSASDALQQWRDIRSTIEEILASELLTRTWAAVACAYDRAHGTDALVPLVKSVLIGHLEARNRALHIMLRGHGFVVEEGVVLNRLRRQTERWTDMLLGYLGPDADISEFAFDIERARDFAVDVRQEHADPSATQAWRLAFASLRAAFQSGLSDVSPNADLNQRIAGSILACFRRELFDAHGLFKSHWLLRLSQVADDTQVLLDDLLCLEGAPARRNSLRR
jgi:hypothetical protein